MTDVEIRHAKQLATMRAWLEGRGYYVAMDALEVSRQLEQGTRKDGKTPKFHHQLSVTRLITTLAPHLIHPEETIAVGFLHDTEEDHDLVWPRSRVEDRFGRVIESAVWRMSKKASGITKDYDLYFKELAECPISSLCKLADRAHNLQTMQDVFTIEKQRAYVGEVERWFYPLIKTARRRYPRQYPAYENLKILLRCQVGLLQHLIAAHDSSIPKGVSDR